MTIGELGWDSAQNQVFEPHRAQGFAPARVVREEKHLYLVYSEQGELAAEVSGRFLHEAIERSAFPTVGDWVAIQPRAGEAKATIHAVLPRRSLFSRKEAGGRTEEQLVAVNVDTVFLVSGLDGNYNLRRIERYLTLAWESGAAPVIVLNKADLRPDIAPVIDEVERIAFGTPIHAVSALRKQGIEALARHLGYGRTVAFLGSSGVGKSALINTLLGEDRQAVGEVREDDSRGRHTTTRRELIVLPGGGCLIDTPGMRELQLWGDEDALSGAFADIEALVTQCRFGDCSHAGEPGCAVQQAIADGTLDPARYRSYLAQQRELRRLAARQDSKLRLREKERSKRFGRMCKEMGKQRKRLGW